MPVQIAVDGRNLNAFLSGEIDHHTAPALRERIDRAIVENKPQVLRLYFSAVSLRSACSLERALKASMSATTAGSDSFSDKASYRDKISSSRLNIIDNSITSFR